MGSSFGQVKIVKVGQARESVVKKSGTYDANIKSKSMRGRKVASARRERVNTKGLGLEYAKSLHEGILVPTLVYGR